MENSKQLAKSSDKATEKLQDKLQEKKIEEIGGRGGLDPSRFGDWEIAGKCVDF